MFTEVEQDEISNADVAARHTTRVAEFEICDFIIATN
jgi:hypothetical protein